MSSWEQNDWRRFFWRDLYVLDGVEESHEKIDGLAEVQQRSANRINQHIRKLEKRIEYLENMLVNYAVAMSQQEHEKAAKVLSDFTQNFVLASSSEKNAYVQTKTRTILTESETKDGSWQTKGDNRYYYINKAMIFNTWARIDGKLYYFTGSGKMATNTVIDGHMIDAFGVLHESEPDKYVMPENKEN